MRRCFLSHTPGHLHLGALILSAGLFVSSLTAEQVQMQNGDVYQGRVLAVTTNAVVLQSEVLGTIRLPRNKVAQVILGSNSGTNNVGVATVNPLIAASVPRTNSSLSELSASLRQLGLQTNLIRQVQAQLLSDAGPEANAKFNQLLNGLMAGSLDLKDLRAEAQSVAERARAARKELGDDAGGLIDGYLAILDSFLKETGPLSAPTNAPVLSKP